MPAPLPPLPAALFPSPLPGLRPRPRRGDSGPPGGESPGVGSPRLPPGRAPAPDGGRQSSCDPRRPGIRVRRPPRSGTPPPLPNSTPPVPLRPPGHARAGPAGEPPSWMRGLPAAPPRLTGSPPGGQEGCAALRRIRGRDRSRPRRQGARPRPSTPSRTSPGTPECASAGGGRTRMPPETSGLTRARGRSYLLGGTWSRHALTASAERGCGTGDSIRAGAICIAEPGCAGPSPARPPGRAPTLYGGPYCGRQSACVWALGPARPAPRALRALARRQPRGPRPSEARDAPPPPRLTARPSPASPGQLHRSEAPRRRAAQASASTARTLRRGAAAPPVSTPGSPPAHEAGESPARPAGNRRGSVPLGSGPHCGALSVPACRGGGVGSPPRRALCLLPEPAS